MSFLNRLAITLGLVAGVSYTPTADAIDAPPAPIVQELQKQAAATSEDQEKVLPESPQENNDILWIDGDNTLHANITAPELEQHGVGVANLISAAYANPNLSTLDNDQVVDLIVSSDMGGELFDSPQYRQLELCVLQQVAKGDQSQIGNPDSDRLTDALLYTTHNVLFAEEIKGDPSQVQCTLTGEFLESAQSNFDGASSINETLDTLDLDATGSIDNMFDGYETTLSDYVRLEKITRNTDGTLIDYASATVDQIAETYALVKKVASKEVELSVNEIKRLGNDAYNLLGEQGSENFISVAQLRKDLGLKGDYRKNAINAGGKGRREQNKERSQVSVETAVAENYNGCSNIDAPDTQNLRCNTIDSQELRDLRNPVAEVAQESKYVSSDPTAVPEPRFVKYA